MGQDGETKLKPHVLAPCCHVDMRSGTWAAASDERAANLHGLKPDKKLGLLILEVGINLPLQIKSNPLFNQRFVWPVDLPVYLQ